MKMIPSQTLDPSRDNYVFCVISRIFERFTMGVFNNKLKVVYLE